jgi:hypothetical protein
MGLPFHGDRASLLENAVRSKNWFYCDDEGHVFQHDSLLDESISWDSHIPAACKECGVRKNLMGPFLDEEQAQYVYDMRKSIQNKRKKSA